MDALLATQAFLGCAARWWLGVVVWDPERQGWLQILLYGLASPEGCFALGMFLQPPLCREGSFCQLASAG